MSSNIPETVSRHFAPWQNVNAWVMCNNEKQPVTIHGGFYLTPTEKNPDVPFRYGFGTMLRWKAEPQDNITTLSRVKIAIDSTSPREYGFGIMLGMENALVCYDFDHVLFPDVMWFMWEMPLEVREFIETTSTYTEISSSGTGLHCVVCADGDTVEYDFKQGIDGKCYVGRFLKLTGIMFRQYDLPIRCIDETKFRIIQMKMGVEQTPIEKGTNGTLTGSNSLHHSYQGDTSDWAKTLSNAGIRYEVIPNYKDTARKHGDIVRTSKWSARVQCPNAERHTGYSSRRNEFNPDVAILTLWDDGSTSLKCVHNVCSWILKPNLLQKLWNEIKARNPIIKKRADLRVKLEAMGVL